MAAIARDVAMEPASGAPERTWKRIGERGTAWRKSMAKKDTPCPTAKTTQAAATNAARNILHEAKAGAGMRPSGDKVGGCAAPSPRSWQL